MAHWLVQYHLSFHIFKLHHHVLHKHTTTEHFIFHWHIAYSESLIMDQTSMVFKETAQFVPYRHIPYESHLTHFYIFLPQASWPSPHQQPQCLQVSPEGGRLRRLPPLWKGCVRGREGLRRRKRESCCPSQTCVKPHRSQTCVEPHRQLKQEQEQIQLKSVMILPDSTNHLADWESVFNYYSIV